jgi:hypothetical protein
MIYRAVEKKNLISDREAKFPKVLRGVWASDSREDGAEAGIEGGVTLIYI